MKVIDNYLGKNNHSILKNTMESNSFFWFYNPTKITFSTDLFNYQFSHIFYTNNSINSDYFKILNPFQGLDVYTQLNIQVLFDYSLNSGVLARLFACALACMSS